MKLRATSIDAGLSARLRKGASRGTVLSAHRQAAYLEDEDGSLIVLAREEAGNGPGFILVAGVASFAEGPSAVVPGEAYDTEGSLIRVGGERVGVETRGAREWDAALAPRACPSSRVLPRCMSVASRGIPAYGGLSHAMLWAVSGLDDARAPQGIPRTLVRARDRLRALWCALGEDDPVRLSDAAASLVGLGEGLTPSCDDMLVGLAAVLTGVSADPWCGARARRAFEALGAAIARRAEGTTPVSRHFLLAASGGRFAERVKCLVEATLDSRGPPERPGMRAWAPGYRLRAEDEKRVAAAAGRVLEYGATSGADLIAGIGLGFLEVAMRRRVRRN